MRNGFETTDVERGSPVLTSHTCACTHTLYHSGLSQVHTMDPGPATLSLYRCLPWNYHSSFKLRKKKKKN